MKTISRATTWCRALVAAVSLCAAMNAEAGVPTNINGGVYNYGAETQINSTDRILIYQGTMNINEGASLKVGGDSGGSCNFIGIEKDSPGNLNINGGTLWCSTANGSGYLAVGSGIGKNNTSTLTLNSGILKVDAVLRSSVQWNDAVAVSASGTITINGGEATVGTIYMGGTTVSTGVSTLNLNGGTLAAGNITFRMGNGQVFTWGGGTLVATKANLFSVQAFDASNTKTRTMQITGNPASFNTAGYDQTIPAFTGTGKLRLTGGGTVKFMQSTLSYGLVLDDAALNLGTLNKDAPLLTVSSLEITGPVTLKVKRPVPSTERYPLIACTSSLDGVSLDQVTVSGCAGTLEREGNTIYLTGANSAMSPTLLHRWSFNGNLNDTGTVGGKDATLQGTDKANMTYINNDTEIKLTDGTGNNRSWISLGDNIIPAELGDTPFTIELWTTLRSRDQWRPCFGFGVYNSDKKTGLHFAFHDGSVPFFKPSAAVASGTWLGGGNNIKIGNAAFPVNEKCHVAVAVTPDGTGNSYVSIYIHKADGTLVGSGTWPIGSWTTSKIVQNAFMLGRGIYSNDNPLASYDEVRVWNDALSLSQIEASVASGPDALPAAFTGTIDDPFFRYDFTNGTRVFTGNNGSDPAGTDAGNVAVKGPNGRPNTAVHPKGYGTIYDGDNKLNADWTLAMSFKSCDVEKGVILCLGNCSAKDTKQLAICSSSTPGKLHITAIQRWGSGSAVNNPLEFNPTGLGDTTNSFHALVAVHEASRGTKKFPNQQETGLITFYWDGAPIGTIDTGYNGGERLFESGFRFSALNTAYSNYNDLTGNNNLAFQDVRFFDRALSAEEVRLYVNAFPPPVSESEGITANLLHRWSFNGNLSDTGFLGGKDATLQGSVTYTNNNTEIRLTDGSGNNRSWVSLGSNIIPASLGDTPFTIELWTTLRISDQWRPCFGFGIWGNGDLAGLHVGYHDGSVPFFRPTTAVASGAWLGDGNRKIGGAAFPVNEKCHVAFTVTPDGTGNATICAYVHKADGTLVGSGTFPYGSWTTTKIVQSAFMLGRGIFTNDNPQSNYDEVRVWKIALTREQVEECIRLGPDTLPEYAYPPARGFMIFVE